MILPISYLSSIVYRRIAKPILFNLSPDSAHERMLEVGAKVQKLAFIRGLLRLSWSYENEDFLSQELFGMKFKNPLGLSAGLDKNFEIVGVVNSIGFGQMEGGSITFQSSDGNHKPWFYRLPKTKSIVVNVGLANHGARSILSRISQYGDKQISDMKINVSVAYTNHRKTKTENEAIADYINSLKLIKKNKKVDLVTLNISCPNTYGGEPFTTPDKLERLLKAVDQVGLDLPLFIKMPIDKTDKEFVSLLNIILKHNVQGLTIANLFKDRESAEILDSLPSSIPGNLSGRPTFQKSNEMIALAYKTCGEKLVISGVGGVFSAEDAYKKIRSGASLVQMVTGLMFEGPQVVGQINRGLVGLLKKDGFNNISDAVGIDVKKN